MAGDCSESGKNTAQFPWYPAVGRYDRGEKNNAEKAFENIDKADWYTDFFSEDTDRIGRTGIFAAVLANVDPAEKFPGNDTGRNGTDTVWNCYK